MSKSKAGAGNRPDGGKERIWRKSIAQQQQSGESVLAFCRARGLNESSFYRWRKRIRLGDRQADSTQSAPPALAPVVVVDGPLTREPSTAIEIVLAGDCTVRVPSGATREQLGMVFAVLEPTRC